MSARKSIKWFCIAAIATTTIAFSCLIFRHARFMFGDDSWTILQTAVYGKYMPASLNMWRQGRFFPLQQMEYNLAIFTLWHGHAATYYAINAFEWLAAATMLLFCFKENGRETDGNINWPAALYTFLILAFALRTYYVFSGLSFAERALTPLFIGFFLFYLKGSLGGGNRQRYYITALAFALYATYCKEVVFGVFWVIAGINLIFNYSRLDRLDKRFNWALIANGIIFLLLYYFIVYRNFTGVLYNLDPIHKFAHERSQMIRNVLTEEKLLCLMILGAIIRAYFIIVKKDRKHIKYDGILFSAAAYMSAYMILGLDNGQYFQPCIALSAPALYHWLCLMRWKESGKWLALPLAIILINTIRTGNEMAIHTLEVRKMSVAVSETISRAAKQGKGITALDNSYRMFGDGIFNRHLKYMRINPPIKEAADIDPEEDGLVMIKSYINHMPENMQRAVSAGRLKFVGVFMFQTTALYEPVRGSR